MTSTQGGPGWYSDPTGRHQLRYFDSRWTDYVSSNGVQSVSPMPVQSVPTPPRNKKRLAWIATGVAVVGVSAIVISIAAASGGSGSSGTSGRAAFCDDFTGSWSVVESGVETADELVARVQNEPTFTQAGVEDTNSVTQGAQDAGVIAHEAPSSVGDKISAIYDYLLLAVKIAHGDSSAVRQVKNDNTYLTDAAELSSSVPLTICRNN